MASTDAKPIPQKNVAYRVTFPIFDADGDLVTGATGLDSEVSKDGGTFADCTNEATEVATASGVYYLDLTSTEMNADCVAIIVKTSSSGAKTTPIVLYPEEAGDIRVNVTQFGNTNGTFSSGRPEVNASHVAGTAWASGAIVSGAFASGAVGAGAIATDAIGAAELAADAVAEIQSGLATAANLATLAGYVDTEVAAIKAKTDNLPSDPADASDIAAAFGTVNSTLGTIAGYIDTEISGIVTSLSTITGYLDTEIAAIKAKTDNLPAAPAAVGDIPAAATIADAVWDEATAGHVTGGTTGAAIIAAGSAGDPWSTSLPGAYGSGTAGKIIGDNINAAISSRATQTSVDAVAGYLDTEIAAIKAKTDNLPSDPADASDIATAFSGVTSTLTTIAGYLDTEIAAIKAKTDNLPSDPADASVIAARFDTLDTAVAPIATIDSNIGVLLTDTGIIKGYLDTEIAAIKAKTDNLPSDPADASVVAGLISDLDAKIAEIWLNFGLDPANPLTMTPSSREAGTLALVLSGDGIASKTVTRTP